jgi:hypothetical protein
MNQETQSQQVSSPPLSPAHRRVSLPIKIGLVFGTLGLIFTVVGIFRGQVPMAPANIAVALLLGGGVWFVIAWAVATAAVDVESDLE